MTHPFAVNCSILLTDHPLGDRPRLARAAGFGAVELWWPFPTVTPDDGEIDALVTALRDAGVHLTGLNFAAGDMPGGDRGLFSQPARSAELRANLDVVTRIGERTGCRAFNALYGNRLPDSSAAHQDEVAAQNLALAAGAVGRIGGTVLVEPLSGAPAYPLKSSADAVGVIDRVRTDHGAENLGLLLDVYHLASNGAEVSADIATYRDRIAHVQIADVPGRGAPGTGHLPILEWIGDLRTGGYAGPIGLEYTSADADPFAWLPHRERSND